MDEGERQPDREAREADGRPPMCCTEDHEQEHEGHDDLGEKARGERELPRRVFPVAVRCETPDLEVRLSARNEVERAGGKDCADHLRDDVGGNVAGWEPSACPQAHGDGGIEMAAGDRTERIGGRQDGQTERDRDTRKTDPELRKCPGQHRAAAAAQHEPERAQEFAQKLRRHTHTLPAESMCHHTSC
jgi:hypothetical protein